MSKLAPADLGLAAAALVGGALFFSTLHQTWPQLAPDLAAPQVDLVAAGREALTARGLWADGLSSAAHLSVQEGTLNYVAGALGNAGAQRLHAEGVALATEVVVFKRDGDPNLRTVTLTETGRILAWTREFEEDEAANASTDAQALALATEAVREGLGVDLALWEAKAASSREHAARLDHGFTWEHALDVGVELKERISVTVSGDQVSSAKRTLVIPEAARRAASIGKAGPAALEGIGVALVVIMAVVAVAIFVRRLRGDQLGLARPTRWVAALATLHLLSNLLDTPALFAAWQPMWPWWVSAMNRVVDNMRAEGWLWLVLFALFAAADAVDQDSGHGRAEALWRLGEGKISQLAVRTDLVRGVLLGLATGGLLAAIVGVFLASGAAVSLQPRGQFLDVINTAAPAVATPLFFAKVAVIEELGYRVFGTTWLLALTGRRWVAVLVPALIFGLSHAGLTFLPPDQPAWGRVLLMTAIGVLWGIAFLRWGALVVVVAHLFSDTFVFSWPRMATGRPEIVVPALLPLALPLVLAAVGTLMARREARPT